MFITSQKSNKDIRSFLALTGICKKLYKNSATVVEDNTFKFTFNEPQRQASVMLKNMLLQEPTLKINDPAATIELHMNSSKEWYRAVMLQKFDKKTIFTLFLQETQDVHAYRLVSVYITCFYLMFTETGLRSVAQRSSTHELIYLLSNWTG